jgi:hypothetical protein
MIEPIWVAVGFGVFLVGVLVGALAAGIVIGKLFDTLMDGLSLSLVDDFERRFKMELINREAEAEPPTVLDYYPATNAPVTVPLGNAETVQG